MVLRYLPIYYKEKEMLEDLARRLIAEAVESYPYSFTFRQKTIRGRIVKDREGNYWIVRKARPPRRPYAQIWRVAIPRFSLCDLEDGKRTYATLFINKDFLAKITKKDLAMPFFGREVALLNLCRYHANYKVTGVVKNKLKPVPDTLCIKFCPQYFYYDMHACRAYFPVFSDKEALRRARLYRGMSYLCIEDLWWSRFYEGSWMKVKIL